MSVVNIHKVCGICSASVVMKSSASVVFACPSCGALNLENESLRSGSEDNFSGEDVSVFRVGSRISCQGHSAELTGKLMLTTKYGYMIFWSLFPATENADCIVEALGVFMYGKTRARNASDFDLQHIKPMKKAFKESQKQFYVQSIDKVTKTGIEGEIAFNPAGFKDSFVIEYTDCQGTFSFSILKHKATGSFYFSGKEMNFNELNATETRVNESWY